MSTRAIVGKLENNGTIKSIYVHSDGYPKYVGKLLLNYYKDAESLDSLMILGDISMLYRDTNTTIYYGRDRGYEEDFETLLSDNLENWLNFYDLEPNFYTYLLTETGWQYRKNYEDLQPFTLADCV